MLNWYEAKLKENLNVQDKSFQKNKRTGNWVTGTSREKAKEEGIKIIIYKWKF